MTLPRVDQITTKIENENSEKNAECGSGEKVVVEEI
jgi:hypothetical protein